MYKRHFLFTDNLGNNWLQFNHHLVSTQIYLYQLFFLSIQLQSNRKRKYSFTNDLHPYYCTAIIIITTEKLVGSVCSIMNIPKHVL